MNTGFGAKFVYAYAASFHAHASTIFGPPSAPSITVISGVARLENFPHQIRVTNIFCLEDQASHLPFLKKLSHTYLN